MNYKYIAFFGILIFLALIFGCTGGTQGPANETKLEVTEGVGIVGTLKIDSLNPGLDGYVTLTVRNNLGGEIARNVIISLDNVDPFKIYECGAPHNASDNRTECAGQLDLDRNNPYATHETSRLSPGEEIDVLWRLRAPNADTISNIALKHPLYYNVEYTYRTSFHQNIVFMSQQEQLRRKQAGEDYQISGESGMGAGELRISGTTQQPIIYFFNNEQGPETANFSFPLQFSVENQGTGIPMSDVIVLFEYPVSTATGQTPVVPDDEMSIYGWYNWNNANAPTNYLQSKENINSTFGDDFSTMGGTDHSRLLYKVVKKEDFIKSFDIFIPLKLTAAELTNLKYSNTPLKIYTFKVYTMYTYFIEGKDYINVYPIRVKG